MNIDSNTIWNEAGKAGLVFGLFSTLCLSLKQLAGLSPELDITAADLSGNWEIDAQDLVLLRKLLVGEAS